MQMGTSKTNFLNNIFNNMSAMVKAWRLYPNQTELHNEFNLQDCSDYRNHLKVIFLYGNATF